jgi:sialidase-1
MIRFLAAVALLATTNSLAFAAESPTETPIFISGEGGYHTYRIPSVIVTKDGSLLAFAEGRKKSTSDTGDIDLVWRRSTDGGATWSEMKVLWDDEGNTCGNPCPVVDQATGTIWLLLTWNDGQINEARIQAGFGTDARRVFVCHSKDDGQTWTTPENITEQTKDKSWSWYATGPGNGIQLTQGEHKGRLVIPCDHKIPAPGEAKSYSHVIYSDDHGQSWQLGGKTAEHCNECEVVELTNGDLLLCMRSHDRNVKRRWLSTSTDGGDTWSTPVQSDTLIEPICQASLRRCRWPTKSEPGVLLFSNPASTSQRAKLTIRASYDDGKSWPVAKELYSGGSAYSCLTVLPNGAIGCLYEKDGYKRIVFAKLSLDWLTK